MIKRLGVLAQLLAPILLALCSLSANAAVYWQQNGGGGQFADNQGPITECAAARMAHYNGTSQTIIPGTNASGYSDLVQTFYAGGNHENWQCTSYLHCTSPNVLVAGTPPSCTCPSSSAWNTSTGTCATLTCTSPSGSSGMFGGTSGSPNSFCGVDNCGWSPVFAVSTSGGSWSGQFKSDGAACNPSTTQPTKTSGDTNCASSATTTACLNNKTGCGTVNGVPTCIGTAPPGGCVTTAGGNTFCVSAGTGTTAPPPVPTPPAPNNGTAGVAATPIATITSTGAVTASGGVAGPSTTTVYNSAQTAASTVTSPNGSVANTSGTGAAGSPDITQSNCGASGQPACSVSTCGGSGQPACNSLSGGTDCTAPPTAAGDPILSYQALQEWKTACALVGTTQTEIDGAIDNGVSAETAGLGLLNDTNKTVVDVGASFQAQTPSSATLSDITIPLTGPYQSVTVPMSNWSNLLHIIGLLVLAGANLIGVRIVMTG